MSADMIPRARGKAVYQPDRCHNPGVPIKRQAKDTFGYRAVRPFPGQNPPTRSSLYPAPLPFLNLTSAPPRPFVSLSLQDPSMRGDSTAQIERFRLTTTSIELLEEEREVVFFFKTKVLAPLGELVMT